MLAVAAAIALGGSAKADIIIDNFSAPNPAGYYQISLLNGNPFNRTDAIGGGVSRSLRVSVVSPIPAANNAVSGYIGAGTFSMDTDNATVANSRLVYTGLPANWTMESGIRMSFINLNPGNVPGGGVAPTMPVSIAIATVGGTLTYTANVAGSGLPFSVFAPMSSFSGTGNLANVTSVTVTLNNTSGARQAVDFVLDEIRTTTVPAPPAVFLVAAAVPVLALRRRMAKKAAAAA
jgi:hypothetical protein